MRQITTSYAAARRLLVRLVDLITFAHMPVRRKFAFFSVGVSLWFLILGITALLHVHQVWQIWLVLLSLVVAHTLLGLFAWVATRSITRPIDAIINQVRTLTAGDLDALEQVVAESGDEIGELTARFNRLLSRLRDLNNFKKVIETDESLGDIYTRLSEVFSAMGLSDHRIYAVDGSDGGLEMAVASGPRGDWCHSEVRDDSTVCRACRTGQVVNSENYKGICRHFALQDEREHLCVPLLIGGRARAIIQFTDDRRRHASNHWGKSRLESVQRYVKEALPVLEAKLLESRLRDSATRDTLTGVHNRRYLEEIHPRLTAQALRRGEYMGVIMCDIDHFKNVNDTYGHAAGDMVLSGLSEVLQATVRTEDLVVRYGGEEFLIVLVDANEITAEKTAERVRRAVEEHEFAIGQTTLRKTVSAGVAVFPRDGEAFWDCVKLADNALYRAKALGRNRVVAAPSSPAASESLGGKTRLSA